LRDEDQFPTVRFYKCKPCGNVYTGSLTGDNVCPLCHVAADLSHPPGCQIRREAVGRHTLFTITGNVYKIQELEDLRARIAEVPAQSTESIAFAFEQASFLSSNIINLLVKTMQSLSVYGKPTFIITRDQDVLESLQIMDLDRVMRILPDLEAYQATIS
jgi:anti-anti-sigma regulatory factor